MSGSEWLAPLDAVVVVEIGSLLSHASIALGYVTLTLDWSAWYTGPSFAVLGFFAALLIAAFYTSLGGKPLFGKALLDD